MPTIAGDLGFRRSWRVVRSPGLTLPDTSQPHQEIAATSRSRFLRRQARGHCGLCRWQRRMGKHRREGLWLSERSALVIRHEDRVLRSQPDLRLVYAICMPYYSRFGYVDWFFGDTNALLFTLFSVVCTHFVCGLHNNERSTNHCSR